MIDGHWMFENQKNFMYCFRFVEIFFNFKNHFTSAYTGDLRLGWFVHENVLKFPGKYLEDTFEPLGYSHQCTAVSPQRFGKPMNRPAW